MAPDEQALRELHATWMDAVNAGDLSRLLPLMTEDVVLLSPGQAPVGREGFQSAFLGGHEQFRLRCDSEQEEIVVSGDLAYTRCRDTLAVTPRAGGPTARLAGHRITIYRRQPDGRWQLARDAHTLTHVAEDASAQAR